MLQVRVSVDINAPPETVWHVLTDFPAHNARNPHIRHLSGALAPGRRVRVVSRVLPGVWLVFHPKLTVVAPPRELCWTGGAYLIPGLFDTQHRFLVELLDDVRTRFTQQEQFTGLLSPVLGPIAVAVARRGFKTMNAALKARIEALKERR
ncbi:MAG: SRPBCC domain-containing protein [Dehalococcoidia bacterium]|nr:SRPBCC domain-containing protein [Dehalococcoidia bacterium]